MIILTKERLKEMREDAGGWDQGGEGWWSNAAMIDALDTIDALERGMEERRELILCVMEHLNRAGWAQGSSIASGITDIIEERDQARELAAFLEKKVEELREQRDLREELAAKLSGRLGDCFNIYRDAGVDVSGGLMATTRRVVERVQGGGE